MWFLIVDVLLNHCAGILFRELKGFTLDVGPAFLTFFSFALCQLFDRAALSVSWAIEHGRAGVSQLFKFIQTLHVRLPGFWHCLDTEPIAWWFGVTMRGPGWKACLVA